MILIFGALLAVYVFCRAILPLRLKWGWKVLLAVLLAVASFKFHLLHLFGGPMFFSPVLPEGVLLAAAWLFSVLFLFFFLLLAADVVRLLYLLVLFCLRRKRTEQFRIIGNRVNLVLLVMAAALATVGMVGGTAVPRVREEAIAVNHLPEGADGLTVAVLADLHVDGITRADRIRKIVERTNALNPDIVIIAGDFVDGTVPVHGDDLRPLADLKARYGVFGVPGNHEYYSGYEEWMEFLPTLGIRMLSNGHVLTGEGGAVVLAGVTDPVAAIMGREEPDIRKALAGAPEKGVRILASHQPRLAPEAAEHGVDLQVSGHTHGGMIAGIDRLVARFNEGFVSGLYTVGDMKLYVSNGAGIWNGFPIRIGVPSEIILLRLSKKW
ncbi:metallophosphoesterase [Akkermansia muciniphila]|uniref:metallophosphoesterase n=1 Tax=Akkermansia muciniphila TaxID=239935 RepID=UPI001BFF7190|nr:metallophosphoesterase [Akkermansia muciniphila]MBT8777974.1 metallophosphoesterase [Akkermansia muciniphila]